MFLDKGVGGGGGGRGGGGGEYLQETYFLFIYLFFFCNKLSSETLQFRTPTAMAGKMGSKIFPFRIDIFYRKEPKLF